MRPSKPSRREFLATSSAMGLAALAPSVALASRNTRTPAARSCIFINKIGGPSQLDTFDPKPSAKAENRGPFRPIPTRVPGMHVSELFPKLASMADRFTLLRGMHHDASPVHEAGLQLVNTGHLFRDGVEWPNVGAVASHILASQGEARRWHLLPHENVSTGINIGRGMSSAHLPVSRETSRLAWESPTEFFEHICGVIPRTADLTGRFLTINQFNTVFDSPSWDCHADRGSLNTTLDDVRDMVAPSFDSAFAALLTGLEERGLLESTLVVATGEFGRTPWFNCNGGRDHWANAWTAIVAGGGTHGGRVIGATDRDGAEVLDRPTTPQELVATIFHALGVPANATIPGPDGRPVAAYPGMPIVELF